MKPVTKEISKFLIRCTLIALAISLGIILTLKGCVTYVIAPFDRTTRLEKIVIDSGNNWIADSIDLELFTPDSEEYHNIRIKNEKLESKIIGLHTFDSNEYTVDVYFDVDNVAVFMKFYNSLYECVMKLETSCHLSDDKTTLTADIMDIEVYKERVIPEELSKIVFISNNS